jgi:hypothetical protein
MKIIFYVILGFEDMNNVIVLFVPLLYLLSSHMCLEVKIYTFSLLLIWFIHVVALFAVTLFVPFSFPYVIVLF